MVAISYENEDITDEAKLVHRRPDKSRLMSGNVEIDQQTRLQRAAISSD